MLLLTLTARRKAFLGRTCPHNSHTIQVWAEHGTLTGFYPFTGAALPPPPTT